MVENLSRWESSPSNGAPAQHDLLQVDDLFRFMRFALRHKWLILLGLFGGLALGVLYCKSRPPMYESKAQLFVVKKTPLAVAGVDPRMSYSEDDVSTHIKLLKSPWLIERAVKDHNLDSLDSFAETVNPAPAIIGSLTVTYEKSDQGLRSDSNILQFSFRAPKPDDCPLVLNAIMETYQRFLEETRRRDNEGAFELVTQKVAKVKTEITQKEQEYHQFREKTPLLSSLDNDDAASQIRLKDLQSRAVNLSVRRAELQSRIAALEKAMREGQNASSLTAMTPPEYRRERRSTLEEKLVPLLLEEKKLMQDFGGGYPRLQAIRDEIKLIREMFTPSGAGPNREGDQLLDAAKKEHGLVLSNPVRQYFDSLQQELKDLDAAEREVNKQLQQESQWAKSLANYQLQDLRYRNEIERAQNFYNSLMKQLQGIDLSKDSGGYNTTIIAPPTPGVQVAPRSMLIYSLAVFLGMVVGFGLALCAEFSEKTYRTPEAVSGLGLPVLGQIPLFRLARQQRGRTEAGRPADLAVSAARDQDLAPILCTHRRPDSLEAEAYRGLRTALYASPCGEGNQIIQITSPNSNDGKTTLAANLAVSIAQSGKRVLLVDADLRQGEIDSIFRLSNHQGLADILADQAESCDVIQSTRIAGLEVLSTGTLSQSPGDLFGSRRLNELLEVMRLQYDFVLVDTPPLLAVSDSRMIATQADGVILTIRLTKNGRPLAVRAKEILQMLEANTLGTVVNGVKRSDHGYPAYPAGDRVAHSNGRNGRQAVSAVNDQAGDGAHAASGNGRGVGVG